MRENCHYYTSGQNSKPILSTCDHSKLFDYRTMALPIYLPKKCHLESPSCRYQSGIHQVPSGRSSPYQLPYQLLSGSTLAPSRPVVCIKQEVF